MKKSEIFRGAREYLRKNPWAQGALLNNGAVCINGACNIVAYGNPYGLLVDEDKDEFDWGITTTDDRERIFVAYEFDSDLGLAGKDLGIELRPINHTTFPKGWIYNDSAANKEVVLEILERAEKLALMEEE